MEGDRDVLVLGVPKHFIQVPAVDRLVANRAGEVVFAGCELVVAPLVKLDPFSRFDLVVHDNRIHPLSGQWVDEVLPVAVRPLPKSDGSASQCLPRSRSEIA